MIGDIAKPSCSYRNSIQTSFHKTLFRSRDIAKEAALIETAFNLYYAMQLEIYTTPRNAQSIPRHATRNLYYTPCNAQSILRRATRKLYYAMQLEIYTTPRNAQSILRHATRNLYYIMQRAIYTTSCNAQFILRHAA